MSQLTHMDNEGRPMMVDVSDKPITHRTAQAEGKVMMSRTAFELAHNNPKGDPIQVAELAGIMAAKKTSDLIPLCHPLPLSKVKLQIEPLKGRVGFSVMGLVKTDGKTGVEMEALTAVSTACLTLYDMLKAVDKSITISDLRLVSKTGGKSGEYKR